MYRKFICAAVVACVAFGVAMAEEFTASITKFEDGKVTFKKIQFGKGGKAEESTLPVASTVKYMKAKRNKEDKKVETDGNLEGGKEALEKLVKEAAPKKVDDKDKDKKKKGGFPGFGGGVFAQVVTEGEGDKAKITEIRVFPAFGKKKKDAQ